jgi:hypothetical protein
MLFAAHVSLVVAIFVVVVGVTGYLIDRGEE